MLPNNSARARANCLRQGQTSRKAPNTAENEKSRCSKLHYAAAGDAIQSLPARRRCALGLSLVRRICEQQGWRIAYQPLPEGGSCFRVALAP